MIDSHAHLYFDRFDADRPEAIARARAAGVTTIINIGIDLSTSIRCVELALEHEGLFASAGIHPTSPLGPGELESGIDSLRALARSHPGRIVAVGEIGLDYHWKDVPPAAQKDKLVAQLDLACELELPVIFHCREALSDLFEVLETRSVPAGGVLHCFSGGADDARRALDLGFCVSFAGNVTYPRAVELQEAARIVPPDRLLLETDAPFLPPQPHRGRRNEPAFLPATAAFLARLKGLPEAELAERAALATRSLFRLLPGG